MGCDYLFVNSGALCYRYLHSPASAGEALLYVQVVKLKSNADLSIDGFSQLPTPPEQSGGFFFFIRGEQIDSQLLATRRRMLLHLLSFEDPAYRGVNFFTKFQYDVETHIRSHYPGASCSEPMIQPFMQKAIDRFIISYKEEAKWRDVTTSLYSSEIYALLKLHLEREG